MSSLIKASEAWGDKMPDWVHTLASCCDQSSQKSLSRQIGYSTTVVNQVIGNKYPGDLSAVKQSVEGALMGHTVDCPELGEMKANICLENQSRKFSSTNHIRIRLYKACRNGCPHSRLGK